MPQCINIACSRRHQATRRPSLSLLLRRPSLSLLLRRPSLLLSSPTRHQATLIIIIITLFLGRGAAAGKPASQLSSGGAREATCHTCHCSAAGAAAGQQTSLLSCGGRPRVDCIILCLLGATTARGRTAAAVHKWHSHPLACASTWILTYTQTPKPIVLTFSCLCPASSPCTREKQQARLLLKFSGGGRRIEGCQAGLQVRTQTSRHAWVETCGALASRLMRMCLWMVSTYAHLRTCTRVHDYTHSVPSHVWAHTRECATCGGIPLTLAPPHLLELLLFALGCLFRIHHSLRLCLF